MDRLLKILLVEDSEEDAELIALALQRGGLNVRVDRVDTRPALEAALDGCEWDVVVADYSMPHLTLHEALEIVQKKGADSPFLIVSATIIEEAAIRAMRAGAHDFIMKDK